MLKFNQSKYSTSLGFLFVSLFRNRNLLLEFVKREITSKYKGSALGILWSIVTPLAMLAVYTFVFSSIFNARWGTEPSSKLEFALILFAGLTVFTLFAESLTKSPGLIQGNANLVKKVVFPLETLVPVVILSALFQFAINFIIWSICYLVIVGPPKITALLLPIIVIPVILFTVGLCYFFASIGTFVRDVAQFLTILVSILLFLSPVFFPRSAIPEKYRFLIDLNPLTWPIENTRQALIWGKAPELVEWLAQFGGALLICWMGFAWFQKTRKGFADVL